MNEKKPLILLSLTTNFSIRAFFFTDIINQLKKKYNVAIISSMSFSNEYLKSLGCENLSVYRHFKYQQNHDLHQNWVDRFNSFAYVKWNLFTIKHNNRILNYFLKKNNSKNTYRKTFKRKLFQYLTQINFAYFLFQKIENFFFHRYNKEIINKYKNLVNEINPDLVITTSPFVNVEIPFLKCINKMDIYCVFHVLSYDNISSRPPLTVSFHKYFVWNEMNKNDLKIQYHYINPKSIKITGPLQFDFYKNLKYYLHSKREWINGMGLDLRKKTILFGGNVKKYSPHDIDVISFILDYIKKNNLNLQIIVRLHPNDDLSRWEKLSSIENLVHLRNPSPSIHFIKDDIFSLVNDIYHSDLTICNGTTIALDSIRLNKPAIFFAFDERYELDHFLSFDKLNKEIYEREHLVPMVKNGGVEIANSSKEMIQLIEKYIENPLINLDNQKKTARYYDPFLDGDSASRIVSQIDGIMKK